MNGRFRNAARTWRQTRLALLLLLACAAGATGLRAQAAAPARMQSLLEEAVRGFAGVLGVAVIDLQTGEAAAVHGDTRFPTASTIKTAVMIEAYHQAAAGRLPLDTAIVLRDADKVGGSGVLNGFRDGTGLTVADLVHLMIVVSDNTATNLLVERLGTARINERLVTYGLEQTKIFRPTFRDGRADVFPALEKEFGLGMTTPREMAALMARIARGEAVSAEASRDMLETLRRQQDRAMIPRGLPAIDGLRVGNKTGTDAEKHGGADGVRRHVRADAAIVTAPDIHYVIVICARQVEDTRWSVDNAALVAGGRISRLVFDYLIEKKQPR